MDTSSTEATPKITKPTLRTKAKRESSKPRAISIPITPESAPVPVQDRSRYFVGLLPDCPRDYMTFGGFDFPKHEGQKTGPDGNPLPPQMMRHGKVHRMTDAELEVVLERIADKWFRPKGRDQATPVSSQGTKSRPFARRSTDIPAGAYVYIVPFEDCGPNYQSSTPKPLVDRSAWGI